MHWSFVSRPSIAILLVATMLMVACMPAVPPAGDVDAADTQAAEAPVSATTGAHSANVVYNLPNLNGRTVVAATADDFTPFQYIDPLSGQSVGYEYDLVEEICRRLNCLVDWQNSSWDA